MSRPATAGVNPRTLRVRAIVLDAATDLLLEEGDKAVTAQRLYTITGVARSTIYRQWPDRVSLLLDTIDALVAPHHEISSTDDLSHALLNLRTRLSQRRFRVIFAALLDHSTRSSELIPTQRRFVTGVTAHVKEVVASGIDDGHLVRSLNPDDAVAQLAGPLFQRHVMLHARITDDLLRTTVEGFLAANQTEKPTPNG